jgi:lipopolysaccharide transport system permease protein
MERLIGLLLTFLFYMTPIIYPVSMIPDKYKFVLYINPFAPFVLFWQDIFLHNSFNLKYFAISLIYAFISLSIATFVFNKLKYKFAELV